MYSAGASPPLVFEVQLNGNTAPVEIEFAATLGREQDKTNFTFLHI